ncbi:hypothetical protein Taro_032432 [Colocasia esculenta]|uniref:Transmembrane protein n=1 Tax=Colocasia esculenta TaxID=4460 RepID=A0A843W9E6_COLES|nr:hypothetical protein [Colocasia esculenta]
MAVPKKGASTLLACPCRVLVRWLAFQQGLSVSCRRALMLLLCARATSVVAVFARVAVRFILRLHVRLVMSRRLRESKFSQDLLALLLQLCLLRDESSFVAGWTIRVTVCLGVVGQGVVPLLCVWTLCYPGCLLVRFRVSRLHWWDFVCPCGREVCFTSRALRSLPDGGLLCLSLFGVRPSPPVWWERCLLWWASKSRFGRCGLEVARFPCVFLLWVTGGESTAVGPMSFYVVGAAVYCTLSVFLFRCFVSLCLEGSGLSLGALCCTLGGSWCWCWHHVSCRVPDYELCASFLEFAQCSRR